MPDTHTTPNSKAPLSSTYAFAIPSFPDNPFSDNQEELSYGSEVEHRGCQRLLSNILFATRPCQAIGRYAKAPLRDQVPENLAVDIKARCLEPIFSVPDIIEFRDYRRMIHSIIEHNVAQKFAGLDELVAVNLPGVKSDRDRAHGVQLHELSTEQVTRNPTGMTTKSSLRSISRLLLMIGGIVLILEAVLQVGVDLRGLLDFAPRVQSLDIFTSAIVSIIVGLLALLGAGQIRNPAWSIILLVLGFLLIGSLGGILVFIGALIALVAAFV